MGLILTILGAAVFLFVLVIWIRRRRDRDEFDQHRITAEELHQWMNSNREILVFDVRQPLDLHSSIGEDRKSTRLNSSHLGISYAVFCLKKKILYISTYII